MNKGGATEKLGGTELRGVFISSVSITNSKLLMEPFFSPRNSVPPSSSAEPFFSPRTIIFSAQLRTSKLLRGTLFLSQNPFSLRVTPYLRDPPRNLLFICSTWNNQ